MKLIGQRWVFRIGNALVRADNAFSWTLWGQERLLVNDEPAHMTGGGLRLSQRFKKPWLTAIGDDLLDITIRAKARGFVCVAMLAGEPVPAVATQEATWRADRHGWPPEEAWQPAGPQGWIVDALPRPRI